MSKIRLVGKICTEVVAGNIGANNTLFKKFLVQVLTGGNSNNPRVSSDSNVKNSFFAIMVFGKNAEMQFTKGQVLEIDGSMEISDFQLHENAQKKKACIVNPNHIITLQGNVQQYAKAYNTVGNLTFDDFEVYVPQNQNSKKVYTQKIAINKKVGEQSFASFYKVKFFGDRGEKLISKALLNKSKVKSILVDGAITAIYSTSSTDNKEYFNVEINVDDFQITQFASSGQMTQQQNTSSENKSSFAANNAYTNTHDNHVEVDLNTDDIDESEIPF